EHEAVKTRWRAASQFETDQSAESVPGEMAGCDAGTVEHLDNIVGHLRDAVVVGQLGGIGAGAALVIQDDAMMRGQRHDLWPPEMSEPAQACRQEDRRGVVVRAAEYFVVHGWKLLPSGFADVSDGRDLDQCIRLHQPALDA